MHPMIPKPKQLLLQEMNNTIMGKIKCPFLEYAGDTSTLIRCSDEFIDNYFGIILKFNNKNERLNHILSFCACNFTDCDIYKIFYKRGGYNGCK